jgi:maltose O-acetyltransferase
MGEPESEPGSKPESMKARMLAGELYRADDPELVAERLRCQLLLERFNATSAGEPARRARLLRELMAGIGSQTYVETPFRCDYGYNIRIGTRSFVNYGAIFLDVRSIAIGDEVLIGPNVQLLTATHPLDAAERRAWLELGKPISIGDGSWLGAGAIVLPGVSIGAEAVIGAGAVVTRDVEPRTLVAGNPARVQRRLE